MGQKGQKPPAQPGQQLTQGLCWIPRRLHVLAGARLSLAKLHRANRSAGPCQQRERGAAVAVQEARAHRGGGDAEHAQHLRLRRCGLGLRAGAGQHQQKPVLHILQPRRRPQMPSSVLALRHRM